MSVFSVEITKRIPAVTDIYTGIRLYPSSARKLLVSIIENVMGKINKPGIANSGMSEKFHIWLYRRK